MTPWSVTLSGLGSFFFLCMACFISLGWPVPSGSFPLQNGVSVQCLALGFLCLKGAWGSGDLQSLEAVSSWEEGYLEGGWVQGWASGTL